MKTMSFSVVVLLLLAVGFFTGYVLGPVRYRGDLERAESVVAQMQEDFFRSRRGRAETAFELVKSLDEGRADATRSRLNTEIDFWIVEMSAHARRGPWISSDMSPSPDTAFLARVARHRSQYPVDYEDDEVAASISSILATALLVESERYEDIEQADH